MKKLLLFFLIAVSIGCDKEDPKVEEGAKPSVESVLFTEAGTGSETYVRVHLKLTIPEAGSVKSVSFLRADKRINGAISNPESKKLYSVSDPLIGWNGLENNFAYKFIIIMQDNTEIISPEYKVK